MSHDFDSREAFFERRRLQFRGHQIEGVRGDYAVTGEVAGLADIERDIEEESCDFTVVLLRDFDERAAVAARQIRSIDISDRPLEFDALAQQVAHGGEDSAVNGLVGFIVRQLPADGVA